MKSCWLFVLPLDASTIWDTRLCPVYLRGNSFKSTVVTDPHHVRLCTQLRMRRKPSGLTGLPVHSLLYESLVPYPEFTLIISPWRISSTTLSIPSETFRHAESLSPHLVTASPSLGRACSFAKGALRQFTSRTITGTTRAFPSRPRARARVISFS